MSKKLFPEKTYPGHYNLPKVAYYLYGIIINAVVRIPVIFFGKYLS